MSLDFKKNKKEYKNYVEDYKGSKSNMKLVYILIGLTALTIALIVLLVMFLNGTFEKADGQKTSPSNGTQSVNTGGKQTPGGTSGNVTAPPATSVPGTFGETVSVSISVDATQIPVGSAPGVSMGTGDRAGSVIIENSLKNKGDLILANNEYTLDSTYSLLQSVNIYNESRREGGYPISGGTSVNIDLEKRALSALEEFLKAAEAAGHTKYFIQRSYNKDETEYVDLKTGLSFEMGFIRLEGQAGKFTELPQGKWLIDNAYLYGFVQRYVPAKSAETGKDGYSSIFRYVGFPHSYLMKQKDMCMEEYIKYLRNIKSVAVKKNEVLAYEIMYEFADPNSADQTTACKLSNAAIEAYNKGKAKITVSGDNFAGFIITVIYTP